MFQRSIRLSNKRSFFLFGARGTGKSTLLKALYGGEKTLWIDLLTHADEAMLRRDPDRLHRMLKESRPAVVVVDEVQKIPKLLDVIQREMTLAKDVQFVLTGSSARQLRRGTANLLAGRAFTYHLFPLTAAELGERFDLEEVLAYGTLPELYHLSSASERQEFLNSYVQTYLREEVLVEQLTRRIEPFRDFLALAAQSNGMILSYSRFADDLGVDDKTVRSFFQILEDTLLGFMLPPLHRSVRKRQRVAPKFFVFDLGVRRAMEGVVGDPLRPSTHEFGRAFEHCVIAEVFRRREYARSPMKLSYLRTKDDAEVDLIVERARQATLLVEIKSTTRITDAAARTLRALKRAWPGAAEAQIWSNDPHAQIVDDVTCLSWRDGLARLFPPDN